MSQIIRKYMLIKNKDIHKVLITYVPLMFKLQIILIIVFQC